MARKSSKAVVAEPPAEVVADPAKLEPLLDIPGVMSTLKLGRKMVYRLIREEGLPTVLFGGRRLVVPSSLAAWIKGREQSVL